MTPRRIINASDPDAPIRFVAAPPASGAILAFALLCAIVCALCAIAIAVSS